MLVVIKVVRSSELEYPEKGHTHGPLDGVFGQGCTLLALRAFDDDQDVVGIWSEFLEGMQTDWGTKEGILSYKLDNAADWESWWGALPFQLAKLTGPSAPHYFRICSRRDLGMGAPGCPGNEEMTAPRSAWPGAPAPHGDDVVMVVKQRICTGLARARAAFFYSSNFTCAENTQRPPATEWAET